ncbi:hypothetical protein KY343_04175 [Candidatus Woesearchaeota archaeon]|nr:hypothetical protein [Candidatus Woesearchaeota archaeon]
MVQIVQQRVSIEHLLPESGKFVAGYLRRISERLFSLENNAQHLDAATLNCISKAASVNVIADVYQEKSNPGDANRIWKIREKRHYPSRRSYSDEAFILKWLQERHAPVPALIALLADITKKDDLRRELSPFVKPEELEAAIERGAEKEGLVMKTLKEPRHDQDLAYLVGKVHLKGIDPGERKEFRKQLYRISAMALESIVTVDIIGNQYHQRDFEHADISLLDSLREYPGYYEYEISKNISRIFISNLIDQGAMNDNEDEINSYRLPNEISDRIRPVFAPVLRHLADERYRGFVHGETQPFHLAMHESPDRTGQVWRGYHLFDFDKSRIDNIVLDIVRYLNNPIATLPTHIRKKLFLGSLIYAAKNIVEIQEQDNITDCTLPIDFSLSRKKRDEIKRFSISNIQKIGAFKEYIKGTPIPAIVKAKDYLSLFAYIELAGRASKTGYGKERHKYADLHGRIDFYHNDFLMPEGKKEPVEFGKFYEPDRTRRYCAHEMHALLDRMISNKRKNLGYKLSDSEVEELKALKSFLAGLQIKYGEKEVPIKYFNPAAAK